MQRELIQIICFGMLFGLAACEDDVTTNPDTLVLPTSFPTDFPVIADQLTGNPLGGWGGDGDVVKRPIVFIHGNGTNAISWSTFGEYFLTQDYAPAELWAISYLDYGGGDSTNSHYHNLEDLENFISAVLDYTGSNQVDLICHSLGVTMGRAWMKTYDSYSQVSHFVGIAGANHGVAFCPGDTIQPLCREIGHPQSQFLTWLNNGDETPYDNLVQYMTLYDGTGTDVFYPTETMMSDSSLMDLRNSPRLSGARNVQFAGYSHGIFLIANTVMDTVLGFISESGTD